VETFTFLFTDIEGSTVLLRCLGEGLYGQVLADHHALIRSGLAAHGGREVDTQGDARKDSVERAGSVLVDNSLRHGQSRCGCAGK